MIYVFTVQITVFLGYICIISYPRSGQILRMLCLKMGDPSFLFRFLIGTIWFFTILFWFSPKNFFPTFWWLGHNLPHHLMINFQNFSEKLSTGDIPIISQIWSNPSKHGRIVAIHPIMGLHIMCTSPHMDWWQSPSKSNFWPWHIPFVNRFNSLRTGTSPYFVRWFVMI